MLTYLSWGLQILILTAGIHVFLRFVRTTRGNPLIRGLFLSVLVGVVGLWGLATVFQLEELKHILEGSTGFIVIGLAIVFQPELRRAIAQIGEHSFAKRTREPTAEALRKVAAAVRNMASRREGALICFEREHSLNTVVETGSTIGARVSRRLLESVFHPGGALHDGAVIVRETQVVAAGCVLPLSKHDDLDRSVGTRHRAAVGLTEESDAVVVVVSEETGSISLAREGRLAKDIAPERIEEELRATLESNGGAASSRGPGFLTVLARSGRRDFGWLAGSALLAWGSWYAAHQSIRTQLDFMLHVIDGSTVGRRVPSAGELLILTPGRNMRARTKSGNELFKVSVSGPRGQFSELGGTLRGTFEIDDPAWEGGPLDLSSVRWEERVVGLDYRWGSSGSPELVIERSATRRLQLKPTDIVVDTTRVDPYFEVRAAEIRFDPGPSLTVSGPESVVAALGESIPLELQPIVLAPTDLDGVRERVRLGKSLVERNLTLPDDSGVHVFIPVLPVQRNAGSLRKDIALVCLSPAKKDLLDRWTLPANSQTAGLTIVTSGLIPANADPGSPAVLERKAAITRFVEENLRVYVDVAELPPPEEGRSAEVHLAWVRDWRDNPQVFGLDESTLGGWEDLSVQLYSEPRVLLEPVPPASTENP